MTDVQMRILLSASSGNVQSVVADVARAFGGGSGGLGGVFTALGVGAGAALVGLGAKAVEVSDQFQTAMLQNEAHAGLAKDQVQKVTDALMQMGPAVGQGPVELAQALYPILSGFSSITDQSAKTTVSLQTLRDATESVAGTTTDATVVSKAMVSTFNAYNMESNNTAQNLKNINSLSDIMNQTVSEGNMKWDEYSRMVGNFMAKAAQAHVPITQANAALAVFTNSGESTQLAGTHLGALFQMLGTGADTLAKRFDKLGGSSGKTAGYDTMEHKLKLIHGLLVDTTVKVHHAGTSWKTLGEQFDLTKFKSMDLTEKVAYLEKITGGDSGKLQAILGNKTLVTTFQKLIAHGKDYQKTLQDLNHAQGATGTAFTKASEGSEFKWKQMQAAAQALGITVGNELRPVLDKLLDSVTPLILRFTGWFSHSKEVQAVITDISNFIQWTFNNVLLGLVDTTGKFVGWLQSGNPLAETLKDTLLGIGAAVLAVKLGNMVSDLAKLGLKAVDFVQNAGAKLLDFLGGPSGITGAADKASLAETKVGTTAKTTMAADVATGSTEAEASITGIGTTATETSTVVAEDSAKMEGSLANVGVSLDGLIGRLAGFGGASLMGVNIGEMQSAGAQQQKLTDSLKDPRIQAELHAAYASAFPGQQWIDPGQWTDAMKSQVGNRWYAAGNHDLYPFSKVAGFASGVENFKGGLAYVHAGELLVNMPSGTSVKRAGSFGGGGHTFNFNGDININAPNGNANDIASQIMTAVENKIALNFRLHTSGYASAGVL